MFVAEKQEMVLGHKVMLCIHLDTCFRDGTRAATKWRETTPNLSFGPKVVDRA